MLAGYHILDFIYFIWIAELIYVVVLANDICILDIAHNIIQYHIQYNRLSYRAGTRERMSGFYYNSPHSFLSIR